VCVCVLDREENIETYSLYEMQEIAVVRNTKLEQFVVVFVLALEGILGNFIEKVQLKKTVLCHFINLTLLIFQC
jgi:hypothetical protein